MEKEALVIVYVVKKFHKFVCNRHFSHLTDWKSLSAIVGSGKGIPTHWVSRLQRWAMILGGNDFECGKCEKTTEFGQADRLSHLIANQQTPKEETIIGGRSLENDADCIPYHSMGSISVMAAEMKLVSVEGWVIRNALQVVETKWQSSSLRGGILDPSHSGKALIIVDSCLMLNERFVISDGALQ
ncbi:unnamed protein product [Hymenolepis diminuta]|uniref:Reverse transcriptase RNase H-like domain-containing protein n=1 Tax=Hymenolepis diminuta TaxID=6216 RepID=A0A564Z2V1_HYMDI|nr:unnamed protein product [Hymenolepis diminuta]